MKLRIHLLLVVSFLLVASPFARAGAQQQKDYLTHKTLFDFC